MGSGPHIQCVSIHTAMAETFHVLFFELETLEIKGFMSVSMIIYIYIWKSNFNCTEQITTYPVYMYACCTASTYITYTIFRKNIYWYIYNDHSQFNKPLLFVLNKCTYICLVNIYSSHTYLYIYIWYVYGWLIQKINTFWPS